MGKRRHRAIGIGVICGRASGGLVAIDVDVDEVVDAVTNALPHSPAWKVGAKGRTLFFRGAVESKAFSRSHADGRRERMVDVLGEGRQTVLPPSIHPDTGQAYLWTGERALEDLDISKLPELPANALDLIAEALKPFGYREEIDYRRARYPAQQ